MRKNIFIDGFPRSGKSTLLEEIISKIPDKVGFLTNEIRKEKERIGFEIVTYNEKKATLASINFNTGYKVSKYCVDLNALDSMVSEIQDFSKKDLLYLDEIGQMELFSDKFKELTLKFLNSNNIFIGTLSKVYSDDFIENIKLRDDIILITIDKDNREYKANFVKNLMKKINKARAYASEPERFTFNKDHIKLKSEHGIRHLNNEEGIITCDCDFYDENKICSHILATEEFLKGKI